MAGSSFDLENVLTNPDYTARIVLPTGIVSGYLESDFGFSGQAEWTSLTEEMGQAQKQITVLGNASVQASNSATGGSTGSFSLKSFKSTLQVFIGSSSPTFSINLLFISTRSSSRVVENIQWLLESVFSEAQGGALDLMTPPFGYRADLNNILAGGVGLQIGSWFRVPPILIVKQVTPSFSKEVVSSGLPLWARAQVELTTFRTPTYAEVMDWFIL